MFKDPQKTTGLTDIGKKLVNEAQSLGITIDVSHLNEPSFWDVFDITEKPFFASHSNVHSVANHPRNLTDDQIKAIYEKHGTVGINFSMGFLNAEKPGEEDYDMNFDTVKKHIDHIINITDINTVAIGSDFDGATMPNCLKDCSKFPDLWNYLLDNGYSKQDINKISHENLLQLFSPFSGLGLQQSSESWRFFLARGSFFGDRRFYRKNRSRFRLCVFDNKDRPLYGTIGIVRIREPFY